MVAPTVLVRRDGGLLRVLPLVPILAYVGFAIVILWAYETGADWPANCTSGPFGVRCDPAGTLYLTLVLAWTAGAGALALLMGLEVRAVRRGRSLDLPAWAVLGLAAAVTALGMVWLWASDAASHYRFPRPLEAAILMAYVTGSLFAFGIAFVDYEPRQSVLRRWAMVLSVVNGGFGLILGCLILVAVLYPPVYA